jgi:hypothetical protein
MQSLNHAYSCHFNRRHGLRGHAQARRYGSTRLVDLAHLIRAYAYVMNNPVEAGFCPRASLWTASSFRGTLGLVEPSSFIDDGPILGCFRMHLDPLVALRGAVEGS